MAETMEEILLMVERCMLGYINERPVAMMMIDKGSPYAIAALYVADEARGKGVGELLVGCLQSRYPTQQLSVDCYAGNTRALNFYRRLGFEFTQGPLIMKGVRKAF
jgi:ribosomal protein S18 acetylase RimI-like enzyme